MRSVVPVLVEVETAGPGPCAEPRDGFLDLKPFFALELRFISSMIKVKEKGVDYISGIVRAQMAISITLENGM